MSNGMGGVAGVAIQNEDVSESVTRSSPNVRMKSLIASSAGNMLEWFDWTAYSVAAVYISKSLFDHSNAMSALLNTLAVFAVGFVARPVGGIVFGTLADKLGRRWVLVTTMLMMALGSLLIAITPTFASVGSWASVSLLVARLLQGFAHGGETSTAYAYLAEIAPPAKRGLWTSSFFVAVGIGSLLATFFMVPLTSWLSPDEMKEWGWRIPFAFGSLLAVAVLWLRRQMMESEHSPHLAKHNVGSSKISMGTNWSKREVFFNGLRLALVEAGTTITYYSWVTAASIYAIGIKGMDPHGAFVMSSIAQVIYILSLPLLAMFADWWSHKYCTVVSLLGVAVTIIPLWALISNEPWTLLVAQTAGLLLVAFITSCKPATISEQVPTRYRTRMFGFAISSSVALFGGTAAYVSAWLYSANIGWVYNVYVIAISVMASIVVIFFWKNNNGISLDKV